MIGIYGASRIQPLSSMVSSMVQGFSLTPPLNSVLCTELWVLAFGGTGTCEVWTPKCLILRARMSLCSEGPQLITEIPEVALKRENLFFFVNQEN